MSAVSEQIKGVAPHPPKNLLSNFGFWLIGIRRESIYSRTEVLHRDIILSTYVPELKCCTDQPSSILNVRRAAAAFPPPLNFNVVVALEHLGSDFLKNNYCSPTLKFGGRGRPGQTPTTHLTLSIDDRGCF